MKQYVKLITEEQNKRNVSAFVRTYVCERLESVSAGHKDKEI